ncbi:MAG: 50S ribosomal subunit protein L1 [Candidatus Westeberhardia cardiocondylae]|nr:50S ribosomal subunit protein L1 [Candidatus Westeberhardia cardiocondylae]
MKKLLSKRIRSIRKKINTNKFYNIYDAISILKECCSCKFIESVEVSVNLNMDIKKSEKSIIGYSVLPHGIGRDIIVAVFADKEDALLAKSCGANYVGMYDLADKIKTKRFNFDVVISAPSSMFLVNTIENILISRCLMPSISFGTISSDIEKSVKIAKSGQIIYRNDKYGIVHSVIGKVDFPNDHLEENLNVFIGSLKKLKYIPYGVNNSFIKKITLSTTMGGGIMIDQYTLQV